MQTARFWTGTGLLTAACVVGIVTMAPGHRLANGNPVEGRVWHKGQPFPGGLILFFPEDTKRFGVAQALIDEEGHFVVGPDWRRQGPGSTTFRICVIPKAPPMPAAEPAATRDEDAKSPAAGASAGPMVLPASMTTAGLATPVYRPVVSLPLERFGSPETSGLTVRLGPEPARIELNLPDE